MLSNLNLKLGYGSYAILEKEGQVDYFQGQIHKLHSLEEVRALQAETASELVFMNPFNTVREKNFQAHGDEPIIVLEVTSHLTGTREQITALLDGAPAELDGGIQPTVSDEYFAQEVQAIKDKEIAAGNASQVIYSRRFEGKFKNFKPEVLHTLYKGLLNLRGQYMTLLFNDADGNAFVGASPERHLEVANDQVIMNPIAGTEPKGNRATFQERLFNFLNDPKEVMELAQVLDEELKMMAQICPKGGKIIGPMLRQSGAVVHTEYKLVGSNGIDVYDALRVTLHAPTLVGSPLESACRIIVEREKGSRRYYGGEIVYTKNPHHLDSAIMIRSAHVNTQAGTFAAQAGSGIVKDSNPKKEAEESRQKANGFIKILEGNSLSADFSDILESPEVQEELSKRNAHLSKFHFENQESLPPVEALMGKKVTIIDNEDNFSHMQAHMIRHMGCEVEVVDTFDFDLYADASDLVILGPGPGDINDIDNSRMRQLLNIAANLLNTGKPVLGICLGHQALSKAIGMRVLPQKTPTQGTQKILDVFGREEPLGFYNSFSALAEDAPERLYISTDENDRVIAMQDQGFGGFQFHPESVLSENGYELLKEELIRLIP